MKTLPILMAGLIFIALSGCIQSAGNIRSSGNFYGDSSSAIEGRWATDKNAIGREFMGLIEVYGDRGIHFTRHGKMGTLVDMKYIKQLPDSSFELVDQKNVQFSAKIQKSTRANGKEFLILTNGHGFKTEYEKIDEIPNDPKYNVIEFGQLTYPADVFNEILIGIPEHVVKYRYGDPHTVGKDLEGATCYYYEFKHPKAVQKWKWTFCIKDGKLSYVEMLDMYGQKRKIPQ